MSTGGATPQARTQQLGKAGAEPVGVLADDEGEEGGLQQRQQVQPVRREADHGAGAGGEEGAGEAGEADGQPGEDVQQDQEAELLDHLGVQLSAEAATAQHQGQHGLDAGPVCPGRVGHGRLVPVAGLGERAERGHLGHRRLTGPQPAQPVLAAAAGPGVLGVTVVRGETDAAVWWPSPGVLGSVVHVTAGAAASSVHL